MKRSLIALALTVVNVATAQDVRRYDLVALHRDTTGACPDGDPSDANDDTAAFQCFLSICADRPAVLHVPAGVFSVSEPLTLPVGCVLEGDGDSSTIFQPTNATFMTKPLLALKQHTVVRGLRFDQSHGLPTANWQPTPYGPTLHAQDDDILIENVLFYRAYSAIRVAPVDPNASVGRVFVRNVRAHSFARGIVIDRARDVVRFEQLHFWPFSDLGTGHTVAWTKQSGTAIESLWNDNPLFSNLFAFGYSTAIEFGDGGCAGCTTSKAKIINFDADICGRGIAVTGSGTKGLMVSNMSYQGEEGRVSIPIWVAASSSWLAVSQLDVEHASGSSVLINTSATKSFVSVSRAMIRGYDRFGTGAPVFENLASKTRLFVHESFVRRSWVVNPCVGAFVCEVYFDNEL